MLQAVLGIIIGLMVGSVMPIIIMNVKVSAILIVVSIDTILGGTIAKLNDTFDNITMISGFLTNTIAAVCLVFLGDYIGVNLYYFALFAIGMRMFRNLSTIRKYFLKRARN